jgi:fibro-slime domain-containing protein
MTRVEIALFTSVLWLAGCGARSALYVDGPALGSDEEEPQGAGGCDVDPDSPSSLRARVRDFQLGHPDFETFLDVDRGIVQDRLDAQGLPVYAARGSTATTSGREAFNQWYRDVPGVNLGKDLTLPLTPIAGGLAFEDDAFFPIDGELFGNEGRDHNFHFTLEAHTTFRARGGERFFFEGDDDLFVFIDGRLALDLGGVHATEQGAIDLDALGLPAGRVVPLDIFFAERHTSGSTFRLRLLGFALCR